MDASSYRKAYTVPLQSASEGAFQLQGRIFKFSKTFYYTVEIGEVLTTWNGLHFLLFTDV